MSDLFQAHIEEWLQKIAPHWNSELLASQRKDIDRLLESGVQSYDDLYRVMRDTSAPDDVRKSAFYLVRVLRGIDRRRAVPPLLVELQNRQSAIRSEAVNTLGLLGGKRAIRGLLPIALDKGEQREIRIWAVNGLGYIRDEESPRALFNVLTDKTDDPYVRGEVIDKFAYEWGEHGIPALLDCLSDESAEVRFWACFGLDTLGRFLDTADVLVALDHVAATDEGFGDRFWHVRREALAALERIYYSLHVDCCIPPTFLISPLLEYDDFQIASYRTEGDTQVWSPLEQSTDLRIDPVWFADQLQQQWPDVRLGLREPKMQSLLLDWEIGEVARPLIGGLQRDGYSVSLTGRSDAPAAEFAVWYRRVIPDAYRLFLYPWADEGREIEATATVQDILAKMRQRFVNE